MFWDLRLPEVTAAERTALYVAAVKTLAKLHSLDVASLDLRGYGKGSDYCKRQVGCTFYMNNSFFFFCHFFFK